VAALLDRRVVEKGEADRLLDLVGAIGGQVDARDVRLAQLGARGEFGD
jgi:hypothetical protein